MHIHFIQWPDQHDSIIVGEGKMRMDSWIARSMEKNKVVYITFLTNTRVLRVFIMLEERKNTQIWRHHSNNQYWSATAEMVELQINYKSPWLLANQYICCYANLQVQNKFAIQSHIVIQGLRYSQRNFPLVRFVNCSWITIQINHIIQSPLPACPSLSYVSKMWHTGSESLSACVSFCYNTLCYTFWFAGTLNLFGPIFIISQQQWGGFVGAITLN